MSHAKGPPPEQRILEIHHRGRQDTGGRDTTPAVGKRGQPAAWRRAVEGGAVELARKAWGDARWSYLYKGDTRYSRRPGIFEPERGPAGANGSVADAARRMRDGEEVPVPVQGPVINAPVWTWQVPVYFWFGGIATGSAFVALAADLAGDHRSAAVARKVALGAVGPGAPLLVMDLGRPARFLHMMRIFKTRSPMSMGSWCLAAFSSTGAAAVGADLLGREREARVLGAATAALGTYLGSYTGALLASTAVPLWGRSRLFLGPIFVCTAIATGAAANRLVLVATGLPVGHPTRTALGRIETGAMATELVLSSLNERRLGRLGEALEHGRPGRIFSFAKWSVRIGLALRLGRKRGGPWVHHLASLLYLAGGLGFRFAWVEGGKASARDHDAVARAARVPAADYGPERV